MNSPSTIFAMWYINDASLLRGDNTLDIQKQIRKGIIMCSFCNVGLHYPLKILVIMRFVEFRLHVSFLLEKTSYLMTQFSPHFMRLEDNSKR